MIVRKSHLEACLKSRSDEAYFVPGVQGDLPVITNIIILIAVDDTETIKRWGWLQTSVIQSWQGHSPDRRSAGANPQPWMVMMMMAIMMMMTMMMMITMMMMMTRLREMKSPPPEGFPPLYRSRPSRARVKNHT